MRRPVLPAPPISVATLWCPARPPCQAGNRRQCQHRERTRPRPWLKPISKPRFFSPKQSIAGREQAHAITPIWARGSASKEQGGNSIALELGYWGIKSGRNSTKLPSGDKECRLRSGANHGRQIATRGCELPANLGAGCLGAFHAGLFARAAHWSLACAATHRCGSHRRRYLGHRPGNRAPADQHRNQNGKEDAHQSFISGFVTEVLSRIDEVFVKIGAN